MAHYAYLDENNIVVNAFVGVDEDTDGIDWEAWYSNFAGQPCKRYSMNTLGGVHLLGKEPFRKNPGGIGYTYDEQRDAFIPTKVYNSWVLNEQTCQWEAPIEKPEGDYIWDENTVSWIVREHE
jgi:hypothetical protein